jgi:hypothetical protein
MNSRIAFKKYFALNPKRFSKANPVPSKTSISVRQDNPGPYRSLLGQILRIGYYSEQDGLNVVWLVYPDGKYGESTTHAHLNRFFQILEVSEGTDFHGVAQPIIPALSLEE